jgi:hypothetical protein
VVKVVVGDEYAKNLTQIITNFFKIFFYFSGADTCVNKYSVGFVPKEITIATTTASETDKSHAFLFWIANLTK